MKVVFTKHTLERIKEYSEELRRLLDEEEKLRNRVKDVLENLSKM